MYDKILQDLPSAVHREKSSVVPLRAANSSDSEVRPPRMQTGRKVPPIPIQEGNYTIMEVEKDKDRLRTVFEEREDVALHATNRWRIPTFNALAEGAYVESVNEEDIRTDALFLNNAARIAYETFICVRLDEG